MGLKRVKEVYSFGPSSLFFIMDEENINVEDENVVEDNYDFFPIEKISKDAPIIDEVEEFVKMYLVAVRMKDAITLARCNKMLVELVSALAYDAVSTKHDRGTLEDVHLLCANEFENVLTNWRLKQYAQDSFFKFFPDNNFPEKFLTYVENLRSKVPTVSWLNLQGKKVASLTDNAYKCKLYFGSIVKDFAKNCV